MYCSGHSLVVNPNFRHVCSPASRTAYMEPGGDIEMSIVHETSLYQRNLLFVTSVRDLSEKRKSRRDHQESKRFCQMLRRPLNAFMNALMIYRHSLRDSFYGSITTLAETCIQVPRINAFSSMPSYRTRPLQAKMWRRVLIPLSRPNVWGAPTRSMMVTVCPVRNFSTTA